MKLEKLVLAGWHDVTALGLDEWLWLDMAEGGLHRGALPSSKPTQLSHAWGWSRDHLVRLRFDRDLPNGVVGSRIALSNAGQPQSVLVWNNRSGKIQMSSQQFHAEDGAAKVELESFMVAVETRTPDGVTRVPITFYRIPR